MNNFFRKIPLILAVVLMTSCTAGTADDALPESYILRYSTGGVGGTIFGDTDQTVSPDTEGKPVSVLAKSGFRFAGWSDGNSSPVHTAASVTENTVIYADFEQINDDIPLIVIETENSAAVESKEDYTFCTVTVSDPDSGSDSFVSTAQIRIRGNASANFPKKSYKIKFAKKLNLLSIGEAEAKDWTLISCYGDQTMLRNFAANRLGQLMDGIEWSPDCTFAEVYLNGEYLGVYMAADQVEEKENRVEVDETLEDELDRDYFIELDMYAAGEQYVDWFASGGKPYSIKSDVTAEQGEYIFSFMQEADEAVKSGDMALIGEYIDFDSLVDMYLLQEFSKNIDVGWSSFYMLKKAGGKLYFTAPWDFDLAFGNDRRLDAGNALGIYAGMGRSGFQQNNLWYIRLWETDWFRTLVADRWAELGGVIDQLMEETAALAEKLEPAMERNYSKWEVISSLTHQQPDLVLENETYSEHVEYMLDWMKERRTFMTNLLNPYRTGM